MGLSEDADDDEDEPAFMPFAADTHHDPSATLRGDPGGIAKRTHGYKKTEISQTSDSSASSTAPSAKPGAKKQAGPGPLSPRRTAELAGRSPRKGKGIGREGSEGSPSMGSSFSDLDGKTLMLCVGS